MSINIINDLSFFYFIGRLNPPHSGHITAIKHLIEMAKNDNNSVPLILLGNGPKNGNPLDNPISFDLKHRFINYKLDEMGFTEPNDYIIKEMTNPAINVSEFISQNLEKHNESLNSIKIIHVAGGKDEDSSKLDFIKKFAFNAAFEAKPDTETISVTTESVDPVTVGLEEMSATRVRKDAYKNYLNGKDLAGFLEEKNGLYSQFFGTMASEIYDGIIRPAKNIDKINIEAYLDPSIIVLGPKTKKSRITKGGKRFNNRSKKYKLYNKYTYKNKYNRRRQTNKYKSRNNRLF